MSFIINGEGLGRIARDQFETTKMRHQPDTADHSQPADYPLTEKLAFLRRAEAYLDRTSNVETCETHMSWVFLTERYAYKLKKPVRYPFLDYSTLDGRYWMCREEVRLNRRLAPWVYLGVVPLIRDDRGGLMLETPSSPGNGATVEWLVKMVRLPADLLLDQAIKHDSVDRMAAEHTAAYLAAFYRGAKSIAFSESEYASRFGKAINQSIHDIADAGIPPQRFNAAAKAMLSFVEKPAAVLASRAKPSHIVEGHGDLRPEHVFLGKPPAIIDCLEFNREFRLVDPLEELAFLWMECTRLGAPNWGELFLRVYLKDVGGDAPDELMWFYMASRACLRAKLALGHLLDGEVRNPRRWLDQADQYLDLANRYAARL